MKKVSSIFYLFLLFGISIVLFQCSESDPVIARVGNQIIHKSEYMELFKRHFPRQENYRDVSLERKKEILEDLIKKNLKVSAACEAGLDEQEDFLMAVNRYRESLINRRYYEVMVMDRIVPEVEIERFLDNQRVSVYASHILISHREANPAYQRTRDEAFKLATEVTRELRNGADFAAEALKYSDDPSVQNNHGNLGEFTWGQMVEPFQEAVWSMEIGEIRGPVETKFGYHVIRLDNRQERTDYNLDRDEDTVFEIKQKIFSMRADSGRTLWLKHVEDLKDKKDFRIHTTAINDIVGVINEKMAEGDPAFEYFEKNFSQLKLASWNDNSFSLKELIEPQKDQFKRYIVSLNQINSLRREVDNQATQKLIVEDAVAHRLDRDQFVVRNTGKMKKERLAQMSEAHDVLDRIVISDEEAREYYVNNPKKFERPAEIELWEIFFTNETTAQKVVKLAEKGADFEALARKYSEDKVFSSKNGYLGFRSEGARGLVTEDAFGRGSNKIGGPIKFRNGWTIYKTGKIREAEIRPFEEVKSRSTSLLRRERIDEERKKWEQNLRSRFTIKIDENELERI